MKKLLSAVTSTVMGVSLMTGAFVPPVSAAGGYAAAQPNISTDGILDVAANKTDDGGVVFDFGKYEVEAGKTVKVMVKANTNGVGIAAMDVNFKVDSPLTIKSIAEESPAFSKSVMVNPTNNAANFTAIENGTGAPIVPSADDAVFVLVVDVPADTPTGDYKISFGDKKEVFKDATKNTIASTVTNGVISVKGSGNGTTAPSQDQTTKTTQTTTKTDTSTSNDSNADVVFDFGNYTTEPGKSVKVNVKADTKNKGVAAMDVTFKVDSPLTIKAIGEESPAFSRSVVTNLDIMGANFTAIENGSGAPITPDADTAVFVLQVDVPANASAGTYNIGFGNKCEVFKSSANDFYKTSSINGKITVTGAGGDTTTLSTTKPADTTKPSTTTAPVDTSKADVVFDFGNYETEPGKNVKVNVKTDSKDKGITAMDVVFKVDSPLTIAAIGEESPAFNKSVMTNLAILGANFTAIENGSGDAIVPSKDDPTFVIQVKVPDNAAAGDYHIGFDSKCDVFKDATKNKFSTAAINGTITVKGDGGSSATTTTKKDDTKPTTTTTVDTSKYDVIFDFGSYNTEAGKDVKVKVLTDSKNKGITAMDVVFKVDSPLVIKAIGEESPAFNKSVMTNLAILGANFTAIENGSGDAIVPSKEDATFVLSVNVPESTPDGVYHIGFDTKCDVFKDATKNKFTSAAINGDITVGKPGDTTTTVSSSKNDTTTTAPVSGDVTFDFQNYKANAGEDVKVKVLVDSAKNGIAGMDVTFKIDSPLVIKAIGEESPAFGKSVMTNMDVLGANFTAVENGSGATIVPSTDEPVFVLTVSVPEDTKTGDYKIAFGNKVEVLKDSTNAMYKTASKNGVISVTGKGDTTTEKKDDTTTTSTSKKDDTTVTTSTVKPVEGSAEWVIPDVKAAAGETVKMDVVVKKSAIEVAGAQFKFNAGDVIGKGKGSTGNAYGTIVASDENQHYAFGQAQGVGVKAADDAVIISMSYTVPQGTATGKYPVKWSDVKIFDTNGNNITDKITLTDGSIEVVEDNNTQTGKIKWVLDKKTAKPGDKVVINAVVDNGDTDGIEIAGAQFAINADTPIKLVSFEDGDAYSAKFTKGEDGQKFAYAHQTGVGEKAANDKKVISFTFEVPEGTADGVYNISWSNPFISDTDGRSLKSNVELVDGSITVGDVKTDGKIKWIIPKVNANPGEEVKMSVKVDGTDKVSVAGAQFGIKNGSSLEGTLSGTPYGAAIVSNPTAQVFAFARQIGDGFTAASGDEVFTITYKVPADATGEIPVTWDNAKIFNAEGKLINDNIELVNGAIILNTVTDTTASTDDTTTVSTTSGPITPGPVPDKELGEGKIAWRADTVETPAGTIIDYNVVIRDPNGVKLPIAGGYFTLEVKNTDKITPVSVSEDANGYNSKVTSNINALKFAFANPTGATVESKDGANVVTLKFNIPADCEVGEYPVDLSNIKIYDADGKDISDLIEDRDGLIKVINPDETTTTTTTTVTSAKSDDVETTTTGTTTAPVQQGSSTAPTSESTTTVTEDVTTTTTATETGIGGDNETTTTTSTPGESGSTDVTTVETTTLTTSSTVTGGGSEGLTTTETTTSSIADETTHTTPVATTTPVTTSAVTTAKGAIVWYGSTETVRAGETATVKFIIKDDQNSALKIAGAQFGVKCDLGVGKVDPDAVYVYGAKIVANTTNGTYAFANPTGTAVESVDGKTVIELAYAVPADAKPGEYIVDINSVRVFDGNGTEISDHVVTLDGKIIVEGDVTETTTTTTSIAGETTTTSAVTKADDVANDTTTAATSTSGTGTDATTTAATTSSTGADDTTTAATTTSGEANVGTDTTTAATTTSGQGGTEATTTTGTDAVSGTGATTTAATTTSGQGGTEATTTAATTTSGQGGTDASTTAATTTSGDGSTGTTTAAATTTSGQGGTDASTTAATTTSGDGSTGTTTAATTTSGDGSTGTTTVATTTTSDGSSTPEESTTTTTTGTDVVTGEDESSTTTTTTGTDVVTGEDESSTTTTTTGTDVVTGEDESSTTTTTTGTDVVTGEDESSTTTTSTTGKVDNEEETTSTTTTTGGVGGDSEKVYYSVEAVPGYYFSHDTGVRGNGEKGGFSKSQIVKIIKHILNEEGQEIETKDVPLDNINFGSATPNSMYTDRFKSTPDSISASTFEYAVPVYDGEEQLKGQNGEPLTITAYIGVKGDVNLDFIVDGRDATATLAYYAKISTINYDEATTAISPAEFITGASDPLDDLAAFLADVNANEWSADNQAIARKDRNIDATDASAILTFYARQSASEGEYKDYNDQQLWDSVVPNRFAN
jgi:hypothetical protein